MTEAFLMDNTPMKLFFDSGTSGSYLSKKYYDANKSLHRLPKFSTTCTGIKIGNGSIIPTLFVIPIQFMTHGHVFEVYTIVAEIDDGMDLVFGFKNMAETVSLTICTMKQYHLLFKMEKKIYCWLTFKDQGHLNVLL